MFLSGMPKNCKDLVKVMPIDRPDYSTLYDEDSQIQQYEMTILYLENELKRYESKVSNLENTKEDLIEELHSLHDRIDLI